MGGVREYQFDVGPVTANAPTASTPSATTDLTTKTYVDTADTAVAATASSALTTHEADTSTHGVSTVAGISETQVFTNKTIDADNNTLSNIANSQIKAAAGIVYSKLALTGAIVNGDLAGSIAFSKLATLNSANILVGNVSNVAAAVAVTGDIALSNAGVTAYAGTVPLNKGGTGQTTKAAAFDALSPMSASGDVIYGGTSGTGTRLAKGTDGQVLKLVSGLPAWSDPPAATYTGASVSIVTGSSHTGGFSANGSGNYTTPSSVLWIEVIAIGGGGGGGAGGTAGGTAAVSGTNTTFDSLTAAGGGNGGNGIVGGAGGAPTVGVGTDVGSSYGNPGAGTLFSTGTGFQNSGGNGGSSSIGGGGRGSPNTTGGAAQSNTGSGGGGGYYTGASLGSTGSGGGSGATVRARIIPTANQVFAYSVGSGGAGQAIGAGTAAGGAGADGKIIVIEHYQ